MAFDFDVVSTSPARRGWLELRLTGENAPRLLVKFEKRGGRTVLTRLVLDGELDSQTLRQIPLGRIEALMNTPYGNLADAAIDHEFSPEIVAEMEPRKVLFPTAFKTLDETLDDYFAESADQLRESVKFHRRETKREPLKRPDGTDPEGFSRLVARAYNEAVASKSKAPAVDLAAEAGVPVTTVHRWIADARRRTLLPPARQGRAG
jgi:hypothetical protein